MGDFAAELLNKLSQLGYQGDLTPQILYSSLSSTGGEELERFRTLFLYLSDTLDASYLVSEEDQSLADAVCTETGLSPPEKVLDELRIREVTRSLQLQSDLEREVLEMESEITLLDRQIEAKQSLLHSVEDAIMVRESKHKSLLIDEQKVTETQVMVERAARYMDQSQTWVRE